MGKLKVLPAQIANMIAAGEVVQRPASVVKELMENAVDADATQISVVISDAGRTLIQVIDNGCGMSPTDAVLCFERHATSKIASVEDLDAILTYSFRGEALASIAAIAEVQLKTRRAQDDTATEVRVGANGEVRSSSVSAPQGSNFCVRNLFYNTPARRKFLKSDAVEFKHIIEEFTRVAITRPELGFTLSHNGKDIFVLKKAKSMKFRILDLIGNNVAGDIVDIEAHTSIVDISGFIGKPDGARKTLGNQFFFVNGRYFRSAYLHKAIMKAYEEMIPEGVTPSYFIFLELDPQSVDVNIHPIKTEIKFEEDSIIFQTLYACVKETLGRHSFGASIDFNTEGSIELPQLGGSFGEYREIKAPELTFNPDYDPFKSSDNGFPAAGTGYSAPHFSQYVEKRDDYGKLFEEKRVATPKNITIKDKYIITPVASGLMFVNIRRAMERILFDRTLAALSKDDGHVTQMALFPVQVQVGAENRMVFEEHSELLARMGFDISPFGPDCVVVGGVPEGYSCENGKIEQLVMDLVYILSEEGNSLQEIVSQRLAEKIAKLGALNADFVDNPLEAQALIDTLFASDNAELTPNGRKIINIMSLEEIDKKF